MPKINPAPGLVIIRRDNETDIMTKGGLIIVKEDDNVLKTGEVIAHGAPLAGVGSPAKAGERVLYTWKQAKELVLAEETADLVTFGEVYGVIELEG